MIARFVAFAAAAVLMAGAAQAAGDYPIDQFERVTQCMSDPSCEMQKVDQVAGPVVDEQGLTYRHPICIGGCIMVCTSEACWCEIDERCVR